MIAFIENRPHGEDFYLIKVTIPTPNDACLNLTKVFIGPWLPVNRRSLCTPSQ